MSKQTVKKILKNGTDEEVLVAIASLLERVDVSTHNIQDSDGFITHQVFELACGNSALRSKPRQLEWPVEYVTQPTLPKKDLN